MDSPKKGMPPAAYSHWRHKITNYFKLNAFTDYVFIIWLAWSLCCIMNNNIITYLYIITYAQIDR